MSTPQKKRQPLTPEQQRTVTQWLPLACKFTRQALQLRGLHHHTDETEGLAADALMCAVDVWDPKRGAFASCLKWWVLAVANKFSAHGARTVHQSERSEEFMDAWSLNAPVSKGGYKEGETTWSERLVDESTPDPVASVDARRLVRAAEHVLPRLVAGHGARKKQLRYAAESVRLWGLRNVSDEDPKDVTLEKLGQSIGVSRERVRKREAKVQAAFERWAKELREEAA